MPKYKNVELTIEKMEFPNTGIAHYENTKIKIKNTLVNQKIEALVAKGKGRIVKVLEKSPDEIAPLCEDFSICGGCSYQNISYEYELKLKEDAVLQLFNFLDRYEYLGLECALSSGEYRNKMEYSFGDEEKGGNLALGMRKRGSSYEVVTSKHCNIVDGDYRTILDTVLDYFQNSGERFYHKKTHQGTLRHLVVRKGKFTGEILINLVTTSAYSADLDEFTKVLLPLNLDGNIVGILHTINNSVADIVKPDKINILYGRDFYTDEILGLKFKISAFSFFQTNSCGAQRLYSTVRDFVLQCKEKDGIIFDLYCGTGTIGQILSSVTKEVVGIEIVEEAVQAATENAKQNNITNCTFITGNVLDIVDTIEKKPNIIILDPPRDGIHKKAIKKIIDFDAPSIIYVSCKPTSLARDLEIFIEHGYVVKKLKLHDLFPRTYHVESVALLEKV